MSPGTISLVGIFVSLPARKTVAVGDVIFFKASTAFSERYSSTNPRTAVARTMAMLTAASMSSPTAIESAVAISSIMIRMSVNCSRNILIRDSRFSFFSSFKPY